MRSCVSSERRSCVSSRERSWDTSERRSCKYSGMRSYTRSAKWSQRSREKPKSVYDYEVTSVGDKKSTIA